MLSNTIWPRAFHEGIFERDGVLDLVDGDVYTSEIPWTKPSPHAFQAPRGASASPTRRGASTSATGSSTTSGAPSNAGHARHPRAAQRHPAEQVGHSEGTPDAVVHRLSEIPDVVRAW